MSLSWFRVVTIVSNCVWRTWLVDYNHVRVHVLGFLPRKRATAAWEILEGLAEKTMQWETVSDDSVRSRLARGDVHVF